MIADEGSPVTMERITIPRRTWVHPVQDSLAFLFKKERRVLLSNMEGIISYVASYDKTLVFFPKYFRNKKLWRSRTGKDLLIAVEEVLKVPFKKLPLYLAHFSKRSIQKGAMLWRLENGI